MAADSVGVAQDTGDVAALFELPLDRALAIREPLNAWRFDRALDLALVECASESGVALDVPERPAPSMPWIHERRYGVVRVESAARWGYRPPPDGDAATAELVAAQRSLGADAVAVLHGDDETRGCLDRVGARVALADDPRWSDFSAVEAMLNSTLESALVEPDVAPLLAAWSDCVEARTGRRYAHPAEPIAEFAGLPVAGAVGDDEIAVAVAVADAACKGSSGLLDGWATAEVRLQERLAAEQPVLVASATALSDELIAISRTVIGEG